jgi:hypothetical protein
MRRAALLLAGIALLGACGQDRIAGDRSDALQPLAGSALNDASAASVQSDLTLLRQVTASFHSFDVAKHAGWSAKITPCMTDPAGAGGMGFHYGNPAYINGSVQVDQPELLLYEPQPDGSKRLVAVEYIVPLTAWTKSEPPQLFGRKFKVNSAFGIWALHVWAWKDNPSGLFADWNPRVNCSNTTDVSTMSHH